MTNETDLFIREISVWVLDARLSRPFLLYLNAKYFFIAIARNHIT